MKKNVVPYLLAFALICDAAIVTAISYKGIVEVFGGSIERPYSEMLWMFFAVSLVVAAIIGYSAWRGYKAHKKAEEKAMTEAVKEAEEFLNTLLKHIEKSKAKAKKKAESKSEPNPQEN